VGGKGLTQTSALLGSPLYMAPEQLASSKYVDHRADIWALGVVLFELVAGTPPFVEETLPQVCLRILQGEPARLSHLAPSAPPGLEAVLLRCLTKDPSQRYANLADMAADLVAFGGADAPTSSAFIRKVMSAPGAISTVDDEVPTAARSGDLRSAIDELEVEAAMGAGQRPAGTVEQPLNPHVAAGVAPTAPGSPGAVSGQAAAPATVGVSAAGATQAMTAPPTGPLPAALAGAAATSTHESSVQAMPSPPAPGYPGVVTGEAVSRSLQQSQPRRPSTIAALAFVGVLLVGSVVVLVLLLASDDGSVVESDPAAAASSPSTAATGADDGVGEPPAVPSSSAPATPSGGEGGSAAAPSPTSSATASASADTGAPARPPRQPPRGPTKPWSPFDDR
jgi:serine/threonine-protein kinase